MSPFPWLFPYWEDPSPASLDRYPAQSGRRVIRPLVEVSLEGTISLEQKVQALVDSGSEHTLAAPWLARAIGLDRSSRLWQTTLGIGGENILVDFLNVRMRLHPPGAPLSIFVEWETELGFVTRWRPSWSVLLGQVGFFDRFTVTMHRHARALVVEAFEAFDERFGRLM